MPKSTEQDIESLRKAAAAAIHDAERRIEKYLEAVAGTSEWGRVFEARGHIQAAGRVYEKQ